MSSIFSTGLRGVQSGMEQAAREADKLTRSFLPESTQDPVEPIVGLMSAERQVEASAKVIKVGDEMIGAILDIIG